MNFLAIGVSTLLSLAVGFLWFTVIFRAPYIEGLGKTAEQLARGPSLPAAAALQLVGNFVMAYALAWLMARTGMQTVGQGILLAVLGMARFCRRSPGTNVRISSIFAEILSYRRREFST